MAIKERLTAYDVVKHTGFLRYLVIRIGINTKELMINIVTSGYKPTLIEPIVEAIRNYSPEVKSIVNTINADKNNTSKRRRHPCTKRPLHNSDYF